jgi:hypothetical protein
MSGEDAALAEALLARLRAAVRRRRKEAQLARHCAWCGRVSLRGRWVHVERVPRVAATVLLERVTHTICEDCADRLEATGHSAPR